MLVACRLAGLSALETDYARIGVGTQFGARIASGVRIEGPLFRSSARVGACSFAHSAKCAARDRPRSDTRRTDHDQETTPGLRGSAPAPPPRRSASPSSPTSGTAARRPSPRSRPSSSVWEDRHRPPRELHPPPRRTDARRRPCACLGPFRPGGRFDARHGPPQARPGGHCPHAHPDARRVACRACPARPPRSTSPLPLASCPRRRTSPNPATPATGSGLPNSFNRGGGRRSGPPSLRHPGFLFRRAVA